MSVVLYEAERRGAIVETPEGRAGLRQAVFELAQRVENNLVQNEYRRAMNDLFFEEFGWKRDERRTIGTAVIRTGPSAPRNLLRSIKRSVLFGLARYPAVLALLVEPVSFLTLDDPRLLPWRDTMVEAVIKRPGLDDDALNAILVASKLKPQTRRDIQIDLLFPWDMDPGEAVRTLGGTIEFLVEEQELLSEIEVVTRAVKNDLTDEEYLALDRRRASLYARKAELYEFGFELGGGESDWRLT